MTLSPTDFDLTGWLAGGDDDVLHRPHREVTVYAQSPELDALLEKVDELTPTPVEEPAAGDEAIGSPTRAESKELQQARKKAQELAAKARLEVRVHQMIAPEILKVGGEDLKLGVPEKDYALLAHAARVNGVQATPEQWASIHKRIGQVQFLMVRDAFNAACAASPEVDALFSSGS